MTFIDVTVVMGALVSMAAAIAAAIKVGTSATLGWWLVPACAVAAPLVMYAAIACLVWALVLGEGLSSRRAARGSKG